MNISDLYKLFQASSGACTDSRKTIDGGIFFALKGANFNGNEHALKAIQDGCSYAVVDEDIAGDDRIIRVENVLTTMQALANLHRNTVSPLVIGITGSNGKTTTKELLFAVLSAHKKTHATAGNFNNHIGVPLTLLAMPASTEVAIIEMGANHIGEIAALCNICDPDLGIITNIGKAHLEGFGSFEGVVQTKGELYTHIKSKNGSLMVSADNDLLLELSEGMERLTYGTRESADVKGSCAKEIPFLEVEWKASGMEHHVCSQLSGLHNLENILCAVATGVKLGVPHEKINTALANYVAENNRSQWVQTEQNSILLDAYNANPSSMELAIANFAKLVGKQQLYLLGDMKELGNFSEAEHRKVIAQVHTLDKDVIFVGPEFAKVVKDEKHYNNTAELIEALTLQQVSGMQILIKGSRGIAMEKVLEVL